MKGKFSEVLVNSGLGVAYLSRNYRVVPAPEPLILVVTPTLGNSRWLDQTVESVKNFGEKVRHILVCPAEKIPEMAAKFPHTRVLAETDSGMFAAINVGLAAAGEWDAFTYINDDDLLLPYFTGVVEAVAAARGRPLLAYGGVKLIDGMGHRLGAIPVSRFPQHNRALYAQRLEPVYQHGAVISRAAWGQCGGFDPSFRYCGDSEFLARLCMRGIPAIHVAGEVAAFRLHAGQLTKNRPAMIEERLRVDQKLGLLQPHPACENHWARVVFRLTNSPVYFERICRHGFVPFDRLLERLG